MKEKLEENEVFDFRYVVVEGVFVVLHVQQVAVVSAQNSDSRHPLEIIFVLVGPTSNQVFLLLGVGLRFIVAFKVGFTF